MAKLIGGEIGEDFVEFGCFRNHGGMTGGFEVRGIWTHGIRVVNLKETDKAFRGVFPGAGPKLVFLLPICR